MTDAEILSAYIDRTAPLIAETQYAFRDLAPKVHCRDGFAVSIQASGNHYCSPRSIRGPWRAFECGYPTQPVPEWLAWRDGGETDIDNVFGYVPAEKIMDVIRQHGGAECLGERDGAP